MFGGSVLRCQYGVLVVCNRGHMSPRFQSVLPTCTRVAGARPGKVSASAFSMHVRTPVRNGAHDKHSEAKHAVCVRN